MNNFHSNGVDIKRNFVSNSMITRIKNEVACFTHTMTKSGIREADKKFISISNLAHSKKMTHLAQHILGSTPAIVRVIFYDKTPDKNWLVPWHQDKTIALNTKKEIKGWKNWSIKEGIHHVQPALSVLNKMVTFRLHLDDADKNNGCLKVIPKSHQSGLLSQTEVTHLVQIQPPYLCEVSAGDLVIIKPHILHSSSKSTQPDHRRVVHIEYSNFLLPSGLQWA